MNWSHVCFGVSRSAAERLLNVTHSQKHFQSITHFFLPLPDNVLEQQDAVDAKVVDVVEIGLPKQKHELSEEKAKVKLDEMVDNYLKPFAGIENKENKKTDPEPIAE